MPTDTETFDLVPYYYTVDLSPFGFDCSCLCGFPCGPALVVGLLRDMNNRDMAQAISYLLTPMWAAA